jgi:dihydrofolate synthase / folylpolyglutamate synthase
MMNYKETLEYLFSRLPMYQRIGKAAYKADLATTTALDNYFGNPHKLFRSIHIAGTNGKGSVSHMLASVLSSAGYKTGLYTSPHLADFRERIRLDGIPVRKEFVTEFTSLHRGVFGKLSPSFFEMTVAMAFDYFAREKVDIAVIETGMGGRLDSTNIVTPLVSVITNIGLDHTEFLGKNLQEIAGEKAGIIKPGIPVVIGEVQAETKDVFTARAARLGSEISFASERYRCEYAMRTVEGLQSLNITATLPGGVDWPDLETDLLGFYQQKNALTLLGIIDVLVKQGINVKRDDVYTGMRQVSHATGLLGRWQIISHNPLTVCDTAHNSEGLSCVLEQIRATPHRKLHLVLGFVNDKNTGELLRLFPRDAGYYFTMASIPRSLDAGELQSRAMAAGLYGKAYKTVPDALSAALDAAGSDDLVFVGGSTFVVADAMIGKF